MTSTADLPATDVPRVLATLRAATERLLATVAALDDEALAAASLLAGWSRATIVAHLAYGARATTRMLGEAPSATVAFYPDGAPQRERVLRDAEHRSAAELAGELHGACAELQAAATDLPASVWQSRVREPRLGDMALSRLLVLRLTEVEVHHADLGAGSTPRDWLPQFVELALPLRLQWLGAHQRQRAPQARDVNGRWRLVRSDAAQGWLVEADQARVSVIDGPADGDDPAGAGAEAMLRGEGWELLALLLGRGDLADSPAGQRFKRAFPGP